MSIPISLAIEGEDVKVTKMLVKDEIGKRMRELGIITGNYIKVIKNDGKSLIISIKESRFGIDIDLAKKIYVEV